MNTDNHPVNKTKGDKISIPSFIADSGNAGTVQTVLNRLSSSGPAFTATLLVASFIVGGVIATAYRYVSATSPNSLMAVTAGTQTAATTPPPANPATPQAREQKPVKVASADPDKLPALPPPPAKDNSRLPAGSQTVIQKSADTDASPYKIIPKSKPVPPPAPAPTAQVAQDKKPPAAQQPPAQPARTPPADEPEDEFKTLTNNVVNALTRLKAGEQNPAKNPNVSTRDLRSALSQLVEEANRRGKSGDYVGQLLNQALEGRNAVPAALDDGTGKLDINILLTSILPAGAKETAGHTDDAYLAALQGEGKRTVVMSAARPDAVPKGKRPAFVIVKPGDTLSRIAAKYYGDPLAYPKLFAANRNQLSNAHLLKVGQRLRLP